MTFEVTILGCGAATPTSKHAPTAQVVNVHDKLFLVDCGEGTQMQLRRNKIKFQKIQHIFISHLHGDHYLGLVGLISSLHLLGKKSDLHIYGPSELNDLIQLNLKVSQTYLEYTLHFHPIDAKEKVCIYEDRTMEVYTFPLKHRIPCFGYQFVEKDKSPKIRKDVVKENDLQPSQILSLKKGNDIEVKGKTLTSAQACFPKEISKSYAFCSDTMYWETLIPFIQKSTMLYHESTFLESEKARAKQTFHSTAKQAATIAKMAEVEQLVIGHYSSRYNNDEDFLEEAKTVFENVQLANEGLTFKV